MYRLLSFGLLGSVGLGWALLVVTLFSVIWNNLAVSEGRALSHATLTELRKHGGATAASLFGLVSSYMNRSIYKYVQGYQNSLARRSGVPRPTRATGKQA
jgi:hypothetical protein